ncbi:hypothetical protein SBA4_3520005 [Candidatus Sulfopaludibacter sp. SbA4]|nr:hypothetical protein SBA4_3520005 [Candidatus Sulfopaludibacter sp. SbA4]
MYLRASAGFSLPLEFVDFVESAVGQTGQTIVFCLPLAGPLAQCHLVFPISGIS